MLGKLLKHEFKATGRIILPVIALLMGMTALTALVIRFNGGYNYNFAYADEVPQYANLLIVSTVFLTYAVVITASLCAAFFISFRRFYKDILGDAGYLTHTLPVTAGQNIMAKLIAAVTWSVVSLVAAILSMMALYYSQTGIYNALNEIISYIIAGIDAEDILILAVYCLQGLFQLVCTYLWLYASFSIGHSFNNMKIVKSLLAAFGINIVWNIIKSIVGGITMGSLYVYWGVGYYDIVRRIIFLILVVVECVVLFFVTRYFLSKRLNLQ